MGHEDKKLSIWDLHHLHVLLANVATKWRAIGDGLYFPKHVLDTIGQKVVCIIEGPMECLRKMLVLWLGPDKPPECDPTYPCVSHSSETSQCERRTTGK